MVESESPKSSSDEQPPPSGVVPPVPPLPADKRRASFQLPPPPTPAKFKAPPQGTPTPPAALIPPKKPAPTGINPPSTSSGSVQVNGLSIPVSTQPQPSVSTMCIVTREDRFFKLDDKGKQEFNESATKKPTNLPRFKKISSKIDNDDDALESTCQLSTQVSHLATHCRSHDIHSVFTIVFPVDISAGPALENRTVDLFQSYFDLSESEVAISCCWYRLYADATACPWFRDDLRLTDKLLSACTDFEFAAQILPLYHSYPEVYRGGPLYLKLVLDKLVSHSEGIAEALVQHVKDYKISDLRGEDVLLATGRFRTAVERLYSLQRLPTSFDRTLVSTLQTTSVPKFNELFASHEHQLTLMLMDPSNPDYHTHRLSSQAGHVSGNLQDNIFERCTKVLGIANNMYTHLVYTKEWHAPKPSGMISKPATSSGERSTSASSDSSRPPSLCWNCGSKNHGVSKCDKPLNKAKIESAKQEFYKKRNAARSQASANTSSTPASGSDSSDPYAPPAPGEPRRKEINGVRFFFHKKKNCWILDNKMPSAAPSSSPNSTQPTSSPPTDPSAIRHQLASHVETFGKIATSLASQLDQA